MGLLEVPMTWWAVQSDVVVLSGLEALSELFGLEALAHTDIDSDYHFLHKI